jgi:hypothetical protein
MQPVLGITEYPVGGMSGEAAEKLRTSCVKEMRLDAMSVLHRCKGFDELDLSVCVEGVDQEEDNRDLLLEQSCCDCRLVFEVEL